MSVTENIGQHVPTIEERFAKRNQSLIIEGFEYNSPASMDDGTAHTSKVLQKFLQSKKITRVLQAQTKCKKIAEKIDSNIPQSARF
jgi:hypothetical protein